MHPSALRARDALALALASASACAKPSTDPPVAPADPPIATAAPADPTPAPEPVFDAPPSPEVLAYLADCRHVIEVPDDLEGNPIPECEALSFEQMCVPDPSGCWEGGRACEGACVPPCGACQSTCAGTCDACKADCPAGSEGCARQCAESRATCGTECVAARDRCLSPCGSEEMACQEAFEARLAERCPDCAEIGECLIDNEEYEETHPRCSERFPRADAVCFEWCYPY